jgi:HAD superfamily hydrolase (TIGR01490 family)
MSGAAFFDIDETLITVKSMFRFLEHYYREPGFRPGKYADSVAWLHGLLDAGMPRAQANLKYYELFAGHDAERVSSAGRDWFAAELATGTLFRPQVLAALGEHRMAGKLIVLVSGSFPACADPITRYVGADVLLCTVPEIVAGRYTGRVLTPMIGAGKAAAVRELMSERGLLAADCHAYGDHSSDLPLLELVAHPVVVGDDPVLAEAARTRSWRCLPADSAAARHDAEAAARATPALFTASIRETACSFPKMLRMWRLTVPSVMCSLVAICRLLIAAATSASTSLSRCDSASGWGHSGWPRSGGVTVYPSEERGTDTTTRS